MTRRPMPALLPLLSTLALAAPPEEIRMGSLGSRGVTFTDELPGQLGELVSAVGDVDGDGKQDFLCARDDAAQDSELTLFLVHGGAALPQTLGTAEIGPFATTLRRSLPRVRRDYIRGAAPVGDTDGDGFDDFFLLSSGGALEGWGSAEPDVYPGVAYLLHGSASLPREAAWDVSSPGLRVTYFTSTKATTTGVATDVSVGDLNGDGLADIVLGAGVSDHDVADTPYPPGRVYVLFGGASLPDVVDVEEAGRDLPGLIIEGVGDGVSVGRRVRFVGDVNGEDLADLLVGSPSFYGRDPSWAYIVYGARSFPAVLTTDDLILSGRGVRFTGTGIATHMGTALAAPGDLNGDGLADFVIGAYGAARQNGEVYLIYGHASFAAETPLSAVARNGLGVTFRGTASERTVDYAGWSLATADFLGDGTRDLVVGAPGFADRGVTGIGRAYVIEGSGLTPESRSLGEVERGTLPGALLTREVSLEDAQREEPWLGKTVAAPGDVNGDGLEDLLVSAPQYFLVSHAGNVHLVHGRGGALGALRLERVEPDRTALAGGAELTLVGAGLDDTVEVRIGGVLAPLVRTITSARLVVSAPALAGTGPVDVVASRGAETVTLPGGVVYVPRVHADIDLLALPAAGKGCVVRGRDRTFALSLTLRDVDEDGYADVIITNKEGGLTVIHGSARPVAELVLPDLEGGEELEGLSFIRAASDARCVGIGDVTGDGRPELAVLHREAVTIISPRGRFPARSELSDLLDAGQAFDLLNGGLAAGTVAGGSDLDGDGIGDLVLGISQAYTVHFVRGRREWPREQFLDDAPRWASIAGADYFGHVVALPGDLDGDGLADVLAGAPDQCCTAGGNGYLLFGGAPAAGETVQGLFDRGEATRLDAVKGGDGLGERVCSPGDMNGDGFPDLAISAGLGGIQGQGETYVVFGSPALRSDAGRAVLSMAALGERGIRILHEKPSDADIDLQPAGDFNGDRLQDLLIGAPNPLDAQGRAYVVFGGAARTVRLYDLRDDGVRLSGAKLYQLGYTVAGGGDFNGDGRDDIVIANLAQPPGASSLFIVYGEAVPGIFRRGDSNSDGHVQLSDAIHILGYLFLGSASPACLDAADLTDDGAIDVTDAVYVLGHLFLGGPPPSPPFPDAGTDPTPDALDCAGR